MTTIVLNTATGAVTEYDWAFQSLSAAHAADAGGLYTLGGDDDAGAPIASRMMSGKPGGEKLLNPGDVYLALHGEGGGFLIVQGVEQEWEYPVQARASGVSRAKPGRGIRESRLALGYRNADGANFRLDRLDAEIYESQSRRA